MKELSSAPSTRFYVDKINPLWFLAIGVVTMALTHMTFSIEVMAWVSSVPFLIYPQPLLVFSPTSILRSWLLILLPFAILNLDCIDQLTNPNLLDKDRSCAMYVIRKRRWIS